MTGAPALGLQLQSSYKTVTQFTTHVALGYHLEYSQSNNTPEILTFNTSLDSEH